MKTLESLFTYYGLINLISGNQSGEETITFALGILFPLSAIMSSIASILCCVRIEIHYKKWNYAFIGIMFVLVLAELALTHIPLVTKDIHMLICGLLIPPALIFLLRGSIHKFIDTSKLEDDIFHFIQSIVSKWRDR